MELTVALISFISGALLTRLVLWYAHKAEIFDVPNQRSSHDQPTPRGGGLSIVITVLAMVGWLWYENMISQELARTLLVGGGLLAVVGWQDDIHKSRAHWRLLIHFFVAAWALFWLGGFEQFVFGGVVISLGWVGSIFAAVGIAWMINLYNFMDGIDGLAASEGGFVAGVGGIMLILVGAPGLASISFSLSAACLGFLVWNWSPAKIFMGDVSSGFIGFVFAVLMIEGERRGVLSLWVWVTLLALFIGDSTYTLIRRVILKEQWYAAHRSHAYQQQAAVKGHKRVVTTMQLMNFLWLLPFVLLEYLFPVWVPEILVVTAVVAWFIWRRSSSV